MKKKKDIRHKDIGAETLRMIDLFDLEVDDDKLSKLNEMSKKQKSTSHKENLSENKDIPISTKPEVGLPTFFREFDRKFLGFRRGDFIVIGGRPAMGKTQLVVDLALNMSMATPVSFHSFELSEDAVVNRLLASQSGVDFLRIEDNNLRDLDYRLLYEAFRQIPFVDRIHIETQQYDSVLSLRDSIKSLSKRGVNVFFIDSLQDLVKQSSSQSSEEDKLQFISTVLRETAEELNVVIVATTQIGRDSEIMKDDKRPDIGDVNPIIAYLAHQVILLHRPGYYGFQEEFYDEITAKAELIVVKNERRKVGTVKMEFVAGIPKFL